MCSSLLQTSPVMMTLAWDGSQTGSVTQTDTQGCERGKMKVNLNKCLFVVRKPSYLC